MPRQIDLGSGLPVTHNALERLSVDPKIGKIDLSQILDQWREFIEKQLVQLIKEVTKLDLSSPENFVVSLGSLIISGSRDVINIINTVFGNIFGGVDFGNPPSPEDIWKLVVNNLIKPLNAFAQLIGGLIPGGLIPGLDASKIISGLFPINRIGNLQDTLNLLQHGIDNVPGGQGLIDKICNALGVAGTGHTVADAYNALMKIPGGNIGSPLTPPNIPGLDASKIISGSISQVFLNITNIAASLISGVLSGGTIPALDASKIGSGKFGKGLFPDLTRDMSSDLQGAIDAGINALRNTPGAVGQAFSDWEAALASLPTSIFNRMGGNNVPRASQAQANAAMQALVSTVNAQGAAINALQNIMEGANGFRTSVAFRPSETTVFDVPGSFAYTLPAWFVLGVDSVDGIIAPAGGGGDGTGPGAPDGGDAGPCSLTVNETTHTAEGGKGGDHFNYNGQGLAPLTYLDILYPGGGTQAGFGGGGNAPGGGGAAGNPTPLNDRVGGTAGHWNAFSVIPTSAAITGAVAAGGTGGTAGLFGFPGGRGAAGAVFVRARAAMPAAFTPMGALLLPTFKLNTGVAQTDAMTVAASWSRIPPGDAAGGHILITRANAAFTDYVYLRLWVVSGVTNYELGRVASGGKSAWKSGTIAEAVPFNVFSLTSDSARTFTIGINGTGFDSYNDIGNTSAMGAGNRSGGWASSDSALPGSITQFAFLDTGTPARITSSTVATSQGTTSTTYADLPTTGPSVTLNVPASGEVTIDLSASFSAGGAVAQAGYMGFSLSGATTRAASDTTAACGRTVTGGLFGVISRRIHLTGLTPGTTTFKAMYKTSTSTGTFADRHLIVEPKP